jgi:hypothetical protein
VGEYLALSQPASPPSAEDEDLAVAEPAGDGRLDPYYVRAIERRSRIGFLAQKLREPRSFDYAVADQKRYDARLQMPQFPFTADEREAVMTFVLGLVAQPPPPQFVHQVEDVQRSVHRGRDLLEQYNCASCHLLQPQRWQIAFRSGEITPQPSKPTFPFVAPSPAEEKLIASAAPDDQGLLHATLTGLPSAFDVDALPLVLDEDEEPLEDDEDYAPESLFLIFDLWDDCVLDGKSFRPGVAPLFLTAPMIHRQQPAEGGDLVRLLSPRALEVVRESNPVATGTEVRAWLPPPLMGEGRRVQPRWLHDYLLDPTPIRPAVLMQMPRFPFTSREAQELAEYFAVIDGAEHPYPPTPQRSQAYLAAAHKQYADRLAELSSESETPLVGDHLDDAMRILIDDNYCVKCHLIDDFSPGGSPQVLAPDLAQVHRRLRPGYLRHWIADPAGILPYTTMPVNIPYAEGAPHLGGVSQDLYHGTSIEQLDALVDLLMNFDRHMLHRQSISDLVKAAKTRAQSESANGNTPSATDDGPEREDASD